MTLSVDGFDNEKAKVKKIIPQVTQKTITSML